MWVVNAITFLASLGTGVLWTGIAFIAKHDYGFDQRQSFLLLTIAGVLYVVAAFGAGPLTRLVVRRASPRAIMAWVFVLMIVSSLPILIPGKVALLWIAACVNSITAAWLWPIIEASLAAGRHGRALRSALGWWNITWTSAVALSLILMAPLVERELARLAIAALAPLALGSLVLLRWMPRSPAPHDPEDPAAEATPEFPLLLQAARLLLPTSYVLIGALAPLMPFLLVDLGVARRDETPLASTWMIARVAALAIMWRSTFWHGRWGTLLFGGVLLGAGFGATLLAPSTPLLVLALAAFGAGQGIIYYAAIYYAMTVGRAAVDAGGTHEALIGLGYAIGPAAGLVAFGLATDRSGASVLVAIVGSILLAAAVGALWPYRAARRRRRSER